VTLLLAACLAPHEGFSGGGDGTRGPSGGSPDDSTVEDTDSGKDSSDTGPISDEDFDGDGFTDVEEETAGSDPEACWSVPSGWPQCLARAEADGLEAEGWRKGKVPPNWTMTDQFGETLQFHQFYGMVVIVDVSSGWCGPCNQSASVAEPFYLEHKDDGVLLVHLMVENWYENDADVAFLGEWAEAHGLSFPVVLEEEGVYESLYDEGYILGIPSYLVYDRGLVLKDNWSGHVPEYMESAVAKYE
jgi:thiol-disulfide isomerase/thioredoxin